MTQLLLNLSRFGATTNDRRLGIGRKRKKKDGSEDGDSIKWRSLESPTSSGTVSFATTTTTSPDRKNSVESRSKVFRHKLQKIYSLDIRDWSVDAPNVVDRNDRGEQVRLCLDIYYYCLQVHLTKQFLERSFSK